MRRAVPLIVLSSLLAPSAVFPCWSRPLDYASAPEHGMMEALILWNQGREELLLKNDFRVKPGPGGELPSHIAWVIPVPAVPDNYGVEDPGVFRDMFETWRSQFDGFGAPGGVKGGDDGGITLLEEKTVGEYVIQPIQAKGSDGISALNAWLKSHGFGDVPAETAAYYVERGWTWLAVKVDPAKGERALAERGTLRPLRVSVASPEVFYPLKFSANEGAFDVNLYVATPSDWSREEAAPSAAPPADGGAPGAGRGKKRRKGPPPAAAAPATPPGPSPAVLALQRMGFVTEGTIPIALPSSVERIQEKAAKEGKWARLEKPYVTKLLGRQVNAPENRIAAWTEDFRIAMK